MVHEFLHRLPVLLYDIRVTVLLPDCPRDNDPGIRPAASHHFVLPAAVLGIRCDSREASQRALGVAHITHPFMEEPPCRGEERTCLGKHLGIGRPSETFIPLRAVCRDRQVV